MILSFTDNKKQLTAGASYAVVDSMPVKLPQNTWFGYLNGMNTIIYQLRNSDLPSRNVAFMTDSILIPMQNQIYLQLQKQLAKDTVGKKPK